MPPLRNARHERFAQELAKGKSADASYQAAGYREHRGNAARLSAKESVTARLAELQERAAVRTEITVERLTAMLLEDREFAREVGQAGPARAATETLARLHGKMVDRKEVGQPGDFERMTDEELVDLVRRESAALHGDETRH